MELLVLQLLLPSFFIVMIVACEAAKLLNHRPFNTNSVKAKKEQQAWVYYSLFLCRHSGLLECGTPLVCQFHSFLERLE